MTDTRKLEGDIGPHFRNAIRKLRERYTGVEPYAYDPVDKVVLVSVENDGHVYTRRLTIDEDNTVYEQDRRKINGHYGPNLRIDREPGEPGVLTESQPSTMPKSAFRRATVRRLRSVAPVERQHFEESLAGKRSKLLNTMAEAERAFQKSPDRITLMTLQSVRIALNVIDERIVRTKEADE